MPREWPKEGGLEELNSLLASVHKALMGDTAKSHCRVNLGSGTIPWEVVEQCSRGPPTGSLRSLYSRSTIAGDFDQREESILPGESACQREAGRLVGEERHGIAQEEVHLG